MSARPVGFDAPERPVAASVKRRLLSALIVVSLLGVAAFDLYTGAALVGAILFTLPLALCAAQGSKRVLWCTAAAAVLLTLVPELWRPGEEDAVASWLGLVNRGLLIASLLTLTTYIHMSISSTRKIIEDAAEIELLHRRYGGLLEAAPDAMVVVDSGGVIVLLNLRAKKQFGYRPGELVGHSITDLIPEGFAQRLIADATRSAPEALAQQIGNGVELIGRHKDGSEFPIEIMLSPLLGEDGLLVTAAIRDISVRKANERRLAQLESRCRGLLEAAPDAMVLANPDGTIVLVNVETERQFGYGRDDLVGQALQLIIPDVARAIAEVNERVAHAPEPAGGPGVPALAAAIELSGRHKNDSTVPLEITLNLLKSGEGVLLTVAIRDITARKKSEGLLLQKVEELNRSNEELGQFAYIASHDLQEPLRMVAS
jgi:PAS domain S-box-containing protein